MPVKKDKIANARIFQIVIVLLNLVATALMSTSVGLVLHEYDELPHEYAQIIKNLYVTNPHSELNTQKHYSQVVFVDASLYVATLVSIIGLLLTLEIAIAAVIERRKLLIANVVLCALFGCMSLVAAIMLFVAKYQALSFMDWSFEKSRENYHKLHDTSADVYQHIVDRLQVKGQCCGYHGFGDFKLNFEKIKVDDQSDDYSVAGQSGEVSVPYSCCILKHNNLDFTCTSGIFSKPNSSGGQDSSGKIYYEGCQNKIKDLVVHIETLGVLFIGSCLYYVFATVSMFYLTKYVVDVSPLVLPSKKVLKKLGFGDVTIRVLANRAEEQDSADSRMRRQTLSGKLTLASKPAHSQRGNDDTRTTKRAPTSVSTTMTPRSSTESNIESVVTSKPHHHERHGGGRKGKSSSSSDDKKKQRKH